MTEVRVSHRLHVAGLATVAWLLACLPSPSCLAQWTGFAELTEADRALTEVPGHPGAAAVVLFKRAELRLRDAWTGSPSTLDVHVRTKILTESGKAFGQIALGHGAGARLERFAGRTVTADGRVVALGADAVFREEQSRVRERFLTKAAFPAVEIGAVLDYHYRLRFDALFLEPWTFDERVPVLLSELIYHKPFGTTAEHHLRGATPIREQSDETSRGTAVRLWAQNLPPVAEEPHSLPYAEQTHRATVVPMTESRADGSFVQLLDSWQTVCRTYEERSYEPLRKKARQVKKKASRLTAAVGKKGEDRAAALHAFVRDEVLTSGNGIGTAAPALDTVLETGVGTYAEKALLLQALLKAVKIPSKLVWAVDWREGFADLSVVNPGWFEKVLVLAELPGREVFLDPGESLAAGRLAPTNEGTDALVVDARAPRVIPLPASPASTSRRTAELELAVDEEGGVSGVGSLTLSGHHAWFYLGVVRGDAAFDASWRQWLESRFEDYEIHSVDASASTGEQTIRLTWSMALAEEHVLGDEVSLRPSRPLGPLRQRYTIPPENRRSAVQVSFADRDEVELTVRWAEGWEPDLLPDSVDYVSDSGSARAEVTVDAEANRLTYRRSVEISGTRYEVGPPYAQLRELYSVMERHDVDSLVLYRGE